jgi:hypothetical protein
LNLHIDGSLKANCEGFGLSKADSKGDFDHKLINSWEDVEKQRVGENGWYDYLRQDIVSLKALYCKYAKAVWDDYGVNVDKFLTLSSMAFYIWKTTLHKDVSINNLDYELDLFVRQSVFGGRCYMAKQYFESSGPDDYLVDIDVISLYPASMKDHWFPVGDHKVVEGKKLDFLKDAFNKNMTHRMKEKFWIVKCDVEAPKNLVQPVLPARGKGDYYFPEWNW